MDETMLAEPMALKVIKKKNGKLKFLFPQNSFLTPGPQKMLGNALHNTTFTIQP